MEIIDHESQPQEEWRTGVTTRMRISALTGATQLAIFDQWCAPGQGAPTHWHPVEEVLSVIAGEAEIWIDNDRVKVAAGQSTVVPAGRRHGFLNTGGDVLQMQFTLAAPTFEARYSECDGVTRRWVPGAH